MDKYNEALEKAKAYDEALKLMRDCVPDEDGLVHVRPSDIFSELAESGDERIRKEILEFFQQFENKGLRGVNISDWIAWIEKLKVFTEHGDGLYHFGNNGFTYVGNPTWDNVSWLEKQDERKPAEWSHEDDVMVHDILGCLPIKTRPEYNQRRIDWVKSLKDRVHPKQEWSEKDEKIRKELIEKVKETPACIGFNDKNAVLTWLEKQGQKPTQETEPFEAEHGKYYYCIKDYFCGGKKQASKGDVVQALRGLPIMGLKDASEYFLPVNSIKCNSAWSEKDRTMAFTLMRDVDQMSYISKEGKNERIGWLNSLDEKFASTESSWSEEDEGFLNLLLAIFTNEHPNGVFSTDGITVFKGNCVTSNRIVTWLKSIKDRVQPKQEWKQENREELTEFENAMMHIGGSFFGENAGLDPNDSASIKEQAKFLLELAPKTEWSEEDELQMQGIIDLLPGLTIRHNWLKSIKQRHVWKPTEKQMAALHDMNLIGNISYAGQGQTLIELYNDLKKLKGE